MTYALMFPRYVWLNGRASSSRLTIVGCRRFAMPELMSRLGWRRQRKFNKPFAKANSVPVNLVATPSESEEVDKLMAHLTVLKQLSELNAVPIARTFVEGAKVVVELDDDDRKLQLAFSPFQALRVTTADCFALPDNMMITPRTIMEIEESDWILELKKSLAEVDESANFMDKSRHFLVPAYNDFIEIAAWNVEHNS